MHFSQTAHLRHLSLRINHLCPKTVAKQLDPGQQRFSGDQLHRDVKPAHMKAIHMIFQHPVFQAVHHQPRIRVCREIKLQNQLDACPVQCLHTVLQFFCRILSPGIGSLGCKIEARAVAPAVFLIMMLLFFRAGKISHRAHRSWHQLRKFIHRLQLQHVDAKRLQVRNPLHDPRKGALLLHPGTGIHGQMPHMAGVQNGVLIGNMRIAVTVPVINACRYLSLKRPRFHAEFFSAADTSGSGITNFHAVQKERIEASLRRQRFQPGKAKIANAIFRQEIQLTKRCGFAGKIKAQGQPGGRFCRLCFIIGVL